MDVFSDHARKSFASTSSHHTSKILPGRLKLYVYYLKLSKTCMNYIKKECSGDIFIKLKWVFLNFHEYITSPEKLENNRAKFDFTAKYQLEIDEDFLSKLNENPLTFEVYAVSEGKEIFLSIAQHYIDNIFEIVNTKQDIKITFSSDIIDLSGESIAHLNIWYKLSCKQKTFKSLFASSKALGKKNKSLAKLSVLLQEKFFQKGHNWGTVHVTDSEVDHFADGLLLVLNRNKVLKTTQSDITTELEQRVRWLRFEANWKQTLQENAILHGKDPNDVAWRQWREEDTANVRLRTYHNRKPMAYTPELSITVVKVMFFEGTPPIRNDIIQKIYVEYSFLGREGPQMETPFSVQKRKANEDIVFNFTQIFEIDIDKDYDTCKMLADVIKTDGQIKFMVIGEPTESLERPIQSCQEIGYAELHISELIQLEENKDTFEYEIVDINNPIAVVGYITVKVEGILAMRKMALTMLAAKDYHLYIVEVATMTELEDSNQQMEEERFDELSITIVKLTFLEGSPEMETPFSLPKPKANEEIVFDFKKTFGIDVEINHDTCRLLANKIKRRKKIKFVVVNEPFESCDSSFQVSQEIGYAEVPLNEILKLEEDSDTCQYEIIDSRNPMTVVGYITVTIEGILAMRRVALLILAQSRHEVAF
ncbi:hypothetical protein BDFB_012561 [Asbolus verrucosus]|uniref:RPGRIP1 C-terminal domain-containing protein n=1 Tax=Asbolus verrucosus TaxID=1661398 RepID=A0A482VF42_ASBVE|nr:hypothetical protein BDFB_012561 [Asbolus verrucosus]